ncbi:hypothetical protein [Bacteroides uniformis]|uniref:hypothetical protein n=1 Tax=Bacteroides uniformis TaxID=820 RepID=UPI001C03115F|nr:hypothetical protein [Bacteroides uniformis]MBT9923516.1 hypothetical protein [Bacteroides uniformis]
MGNVKIKYFVEFVVATPDGAKEVCINVLNIVSLERFNNHTLLHMAASESGKGHIVYRVTENYDSVISQIENALKSSIL